MIAPTWSQPRPLQIKISARFGDTSMAFTFLASAKPALHRLKDFSILLDLRDAQNFKQDGLFMAWTHRVFDCLQHSL